MKNFRSAFSITEISIILLVVGVIVGGSFQTSRVMNRASLNSARSKTEKSPVASIPGLYAWFETTSLVSFLEAKDDSDAIVTDPKEIKDGYQITEWRNLSPLSLNGKAVAKAIDGNDWCIGKGPIYREKGLNNLPTLEFSSTGGDDNYGNCLYLDKNNSQIGPSENFTIFIVSKMEVDTDPGEEILLNINQNDITTVGTTIRYKKPSSDNTVKFYWNNYLCSDDCIETNTITDSVTNFGIYTFEYYSEATDDVAKIYYGNTILGDGSTDSTIRNDQDGSAPFNTIIGTSINSSGVINGAGNVSFDGEIAEIIIYGRKLKTKEIEQIQKYLSNKWRIKI